MTDFIQYRNIKRFDNLPFEQYKQINEIEQSYSFSFLNKERYGTLSQMEVTDNMRIGSLVDGILTNPYEIDFNDDNTERLYALAKAMAYDIRKEFGELIKHFETQISYFADVEFHGWKMRTNGRLDFLLPGHAVIDLKVTTAKDVESLIEYMGYKNQVRHYCSLAGVNKGYIMIYSRPLRKTFIIPVDLNEGNEWMENKILKFGTYVG